MKSKKIAAAILLIVISSTFLTGCFKKEPAKTTKQDKVELVYYRMFDNEDVMRPIIDEYSSKHPNVTITYRKFTDLKEYQNLILNELAEGEGPDMFSAPNYWVLGNVKKLSPMPEEMMKTSDFENTFVSVAKNDLVLRDPATGTSRIFGLPMMVDTLALYYNKSAYEDKIPSRGKPAATWEELKDDVFKLTKKDNSFERFEVAGIAMGRSDNISRAVDILLMLMLQYKTNFYNDNISQAEFSKQRSTVTGTSGNPATQALDLYTSFAMPANKNYSWNAYIADSKSDEKELDSFVKGKVVMVFGYSYLYEQIQSKIKELSAKGIKTIKADDVKVSVVPQVIDTKTSTEKRDAYANYFVETVSRTSAHPREAWDFLNFMSSKENMAFYNEKTHRPSSRRDLIEDQKKDPVYGVFAEQTGYAESVPAYNYDRFYEILAKAIDSVLATISPSDAIKLAESEISNTLPAEGLIPPAADKTAAVKN